VWVNIVQHVFVCVLALCVWLLALPVMTQLACMYISACMHYALCHRGVLKAHYRARARTLFASLVQFVAVCIVIHTFLSLSLHLA